MKLKITIITSLILCIAIFWYREVRTKLEIRRILFIQDYSNDYFVAICGYYLAEGKLPANLSDIAEYSVKRGMNKETYDKIINLEFNEPGKGGATTKYLDNESFKIALASAEKIKFQWKIHRQIQINKYDIDKLSDEEVFNLFLNNDFDYSVFINRFDEINKRCNIKENFYKLMEEHVNMIFSNQKEYDKTLLISLIKNIQSNININSNKNASQDASQP